MISNRVTLLPRLYFRRLSIFCRSCGTKPSLNNAVQAKASAEAIPVAAKDVIIYKFDSPRFFKFLNIFAITQYGVWMYISYSSLGMADAPVKELTKEEEENLPFWRKMNLGQDKYKYGLTFGSAFMGKRQEKSSKNATLQSIRLTQHFIWVKFLVLRKDGRTVSFVTYTPFGQNRIIDVPIKNVSALGSRQSGSSQIPVKVKGKSWFYLVDVKQGKFPRPQLFDQTVGTKRKI